VTQTAHTAERMLALGSSMFPCVLSGSVLTLQPVAAAELAPGDIVVYVSERGLCAHRLLQLLPDGRVRVRGDAQEYTETLEASALAFVVTHVAHRRLSYATRAPLGRFLARCALRRGAAFPLAAGLARYASRHALRALARSAGVEPLMGLLVRAASRGAPAGATAHSPGSGQGAAPLRERVGRALASRLTGRVVWPPAARAAALSGVLQLSSARPSLAPEGPVTARDSLLRGLKHELRTPLNAILGFADLLLGELDGPLNADERENVSVVRDAGWKLLGLINEVLDLATALMLPAEPVCEEHDVNLLLEEVRHEIEQRAGMRPVHVGVDGAHAPLEARIDRRLLSRALRALGDSALHATTAGGITLGAALRGSELQLWVAADGFQARPDHALDPVELALGPARAHDRARRIGGMRIAIVARLLALHGGGLSAERRADRGALCVRMPLTAAGAAHAGDDAQSADVALALAYIAAMSHDLRTPLNAILGFADLLSMDKREAWSAAQRRSLDIVRERALDLAAMVDDMIDWAKLEAGELELRRELTEIGPILERALAAATERSGARGLSLSLHNETADEGKVWADASRCVQALLGLLDHAIRAPGREVQVRVQRTAAHVQIEIEDPGLEIREEDHTGVFDAFRPSYAPTGQRIAGLQLGPSVARSLLRAHGGDVWFESRPGRGTTFTATLPVATQSSG